MEITKREFLHVQLIFIQPQKFLLTHLKPYLFADDTNCLHTYVCSSVELDHKLSQHDLLTTYSNSWHLLIFK